MKNDFVKKKLKLSKGVLAKIKSLHPDEIRNMKKFMDKGLIFRVHPSTCSIIEESNHPEVIEIFLFINMSEALVLSVESEKPNGKIYSLNFRHEFSHPQLGYGNDIHIKEKLCSVKIDSAVLSDLFGKISK